jgi:hypothetical protein
VGLVVDDRTLASQLTPQLKQHLGPVVIFDSVEGARSAGRSGQIHTLVRVDSKVYQSQSEAFEVQIPSCQVSATAEVLRLPAATVLLSDSISSTRPDCVTAFEDVGTQLAQAIAAAALAQQGARGSRSVADLYLQVPGNVDQGQLEALRTRLQTVPGVEGVFSDGPDSPWRLEVTGEMRDLVHRIDQLPGLRIASLAGSSARLEFLRPEDG